MRAHEYTGVRNYIAVDRFNGARMCILEVGLEHVTVQGWVHRQTFTRAGFRERYRVKRVRL